MKFLAVLAVIGVVIYEVSLRLAVFLGAVCCILLFAAVINDWFSGVRDSVRIRLRANRKAAAA